MADLFISAFVTLFVVIDPIGCAPIYAGMARGASEAQFREMAIRAIVISTGVLVFFALLGERLLSALHIELDAFRIAGGIMLFVIALEMVFEKRTQRRERRVEQLQTTPEVEDVSVFPMAMPMIAGPGSIATVMLLMGRAEGLDGTFVVLGALGAVLLVTALALLLARPLLRLVGSRAEAVISRMLGVLLGALAAQYVIDGVRAALHLQ